MYQPANTSHSFNDVNICKPFLKWAGGKRQLLPEILARIPRTFNRYFEPFLGGGALFFYLQPNDSYLCDINEELINVYLIVRDDVYALIDSLKKHKNTEEYYYRIRNKDRDDNFVNSSCLERASRFIYLNRTGFNGLWRVNSKGQYNVPFGKYKSPKICDSDNLIACSHALKKASFLGVEDFDSIEKHTKANDFVYFDPPYHPLNSTSNFTSYAKGGFYEEDQIRLKKLIDRLTQKGVKVMLSNSSAKFILELYKNKYRIDFVSARRAINSNAQKRGEVKEVLIMNY